MASKKQENMGRMNKKVFDKLGKEDQTNYKLSRTTLDKIAVNNRTYKLSPVGKTNKKRKQVKKKGAL